MRFNLVVRGVEIPKYQKMYFHQTMKEEKILNWKVEADASKYYFIKSFLGKYLYPSGGDK